MSQYPQLIDNNITLPIIDLNTSLTPSLLNKFRDAIYKIEVELGVFPSGDTYSDVRTRLDAMEGRLGGTVSINGDVGGNYSNPVVIGINGTPINITEPIQNGQALIYDSFNSSWTNKFISLDNLKPPFTFNFNTVDCALLEVGETLNHPTFEAEYTDVDFYSLILSNDDDGYEQDVKLTPNCFTSESSHTKNYFGNFVKYDLNCRTTINPSVLKTKSVVFIWGQKTYWGVSEDPGSIDGYFVQSLSDYELTIVKSKKISLTAGPNQYIYFSCRAGYGNVEFIVNDFEGGFTKVASEIEINGENYDVYRSDNPNLGKTCIIVF